LLLGCDDGNGAAEAGGAAPRSGGGNSGSGGSGDSGANGTGAGVAEVFSLGDYGEPCPVPEPLPKIDPTQLSGGTPLVAREGVTAFKPWGNAEMAKTAVVSVEGQAFEQALRAETLREAQNVWDAQVVTPNVAPARKGDVALATFYARCLASKEETGECVTAFVFESASPDHTKSASSTVRVGREWKRYDVPFKLAGTYEASGATVLFRLGYRPQTLELGGVTVVNYGTSLALEQFPQAPVKYEGEAADAPWRAEAAERIEKLRKGEAAVRVLDTAGNPVVDADVKLTLTRHAFQFGSALSTNFIAASASPDAQRYQELFPKIFDVMVPENALKWPALAGDWGAAFGVSGAESAVAWAESRGLRSKGHTLVWPSWKNSPKYLATLVNDKEALRAEVRKHVRDVVTAFRGRLDQWDVVNEPFDNHEITDLLGAEEMVEWYKIAKEADPEAQLLINDYAILSGGGGNTAHRDAYEKLIEFLRDSGAPLEGIGMQGHFGGTLTGMSDAWAILNRYGAHELPIYITEYDVGVADSAVAGRYTRDLLTLLFSHPSVQGFIMWGFWDGAHWKENAPLYAKPWCLKEAGVAYLELVKDRWWTRAAGSTDASGRFTSRGFLGRYAVSVRYQGKTGRAEFELGAPGREVTVTLE
jgi:GH35 family endo-1,4-beta-xylanase